MDQKTDQKTDRKTDQKELIRNRMAVLRQKMTERGIDAYVIVSDDFHASEYVGDYFKCRKYMTGFSGSAGTAVVLQKEACLWTDGRYFLQAKEQLSGTGIQLMKQGEPGVPTITGYLKAQLPDGAVVGYDGRTISVKFAQKLEAALSEKQVTFSQKQDLVGEIWTDRPAFPAGRIWELDSAYTGSTRKEKLEQVCGDVRKAGADTYLLASLDDIAWLLNLRGEDIAFNPVAMAYVLMKEGETFLYAAPHAMDEALKARLLLDGVQLRPYLQIYEDLNCLGKRTIFVDEATSNVALLSSIDARAVIVTGNNPTRIRKAVKTLTEQENEKEAHRKDGAAVTRLIYRVKQWAEKNSETLLTELDICRMLEEMRKEGKDYLGQSFGPIAAVGAHGAIVHYGPTEESNAPLEAGTFLLLDTGGQYLQGTTDITRTIALGNLSETQKLHYTTVLKGNLALGAARFRHGCTGANLDVLARSPLWELSLDYNHGTGHGVGYLLNVHEGPNSIRLGGTDGMLGAVLQDGMITSNEPGLYLEGAYGIRLENLVLCKEDGKSAFGTFLHFETLTLVPFDREAILPEVLTEKERGLLNAYHARVRKEILPFLSGEEAAWLLTETEPI